MTSDHNKETQKKKEKKKKINKKAELSQRESIKATWLRAMQ